MVDRKISSWWRDLCRICDVGNQLNWFESRIGWNLGNENQIRFWNDKWVGNLLLKEKFPRLYSMSLNKESLVCEMGEWVKNKTEKTLSGGFVGGDV